MTEQVQRWTSPNDANHSNHHAKVGDVEFFRFPYSAYMGRVGQFTCTVSTRFSNGKYYATVFQPMPHRAGATLPVVRKNSESQDELFAWAAARMTELDKEAK